MSKNKLEKGTFGVFPASICKGLDPTQQVLICWLWFHANQDGECFPSLAFLSEEVGASPRTIQTHLDVLEEMKLIRRTRRKRPGCKEYDSTVYEVLVPEVRKDLQEVAQELPNHTQNLPNGVRKNLPSNQKNSLEPNNTKEKYKKENFKIPTLEEVHAYCQERKNSIDPEQFVDHYTARGWTFKNKQPMVDWKAAVRTWEKNNHAAAPPPSEKKDAPLPVIGKVLNRF